ncbi:hypothetical protein L6R52_10865 [Myxococcota bacterium]|nr:hypothetical protein [Myxococcota bacterium]
MAIEIDYNRYIPLPIFDAAGGLALSRALVAAHPRGLPAKVKKLLEQLKVADASLRERWRDADLEEVDTRRPADLALDRAWGAFHDRIRTHSEMPTERVKNAAEAKALHAKLFPTGLQFLKLPYVEEWAESEKRLERIRDEGLERALDRIAGPEYLEEVRHCHKVYGAVLGITERREAAEAAPGGLERLRELRKVMQRYVSNLVVLGDEEELEPLVRAALAPIDEFRAQAGTRRARGDNDRDAPVPEAPVPAAPVAPRGGDDVIPAAPVEDVDPR